MGRSAAPTGASPQSLPMMEGEGVDTAFGERGGTGAAVERERNALLLTDRRVIRVSRTKAGLSTTFLSLGDVLSAEVLHRSRGARRLFRMAILLAGVAAALIAVEWPPLSLGLAALLGLGALHHLYQYIAVSQEGVILFRTAQQELSMPYRGRSSRDAYDLVNRFFDLKAAYSTAPDKADDDLVEKKPPERPGSPFRMLQGYRSWYDTWFLDRSAPLSEIDLRDGAEGYESWFLERLHDRTERRRAERPGTPFKVVKPWGREAWYEVWFLDKDIPVSELPAPELPTQDEPTPDARQRRGRPRHRRRSWTLRLNGPGRGPSVGYVRVAGKPVSAGRGKRRVSPA